MNAKRKPHDRMDEIRKRISNDVPLNMWDAQILWDEKERLRKELEEAQAVIHDFIEGIGATNLLAEKDTEIAKLMKEIVGLREQVTIFERM